MHVFCVTELHNFNDVYSVSFVQHIEAQMSDLLLFFPAVSFMTLRISNNRCTHRVNGTVNSLVRICLIFQFRILHIQPQASGSSFPCFAELSSVIFSSSAPFPSDSMSHFTSKFSPTGLLKGLLHTYCPTHFSLDKNPPCPLIL